MKIIDLLDDRSILLDGRVADKKAALDQMVKELRFRIANRMRLSNRDLQLWL